MVAGEDLFYRTSEAFIDHSSDSMYFPLSKPVVYDLGVYFAQVKFSLRFIPPVGEGGVSLRVESWVEGRKIMGNLIREKQQLYDLQKKKIVSISL